MRLRFRCSRSDDPEESVALVPDNEVPTVFSSSLLLGLAMPLLWWTTVVCRLVHHAVVCTNHSCKGKRTFARTCQYSFQSIGNSFTNTTFNAARIAVALVVFPGMALQRTVVSNKVGGAWLSLAWPAQDVGSDLSRES